MGISNLDIRNALQDLHREGHLTMGERDKVYEALGVHHEHGETGHHDIKGYTKDIQKHHPELSEFQRRKIEETLKPMLDKHYGERTRESHEGEKAA